MGYKNNSIFAQLFVFFSMVRAVIWICVLAILYEYPLAQITILTIMSLIMLVMIIIKRPFNKMITVIEFSVYEFVIFFVHLNIMILGVLDRIGDTDSGTRDKIGIAIIFGFTIFGIIALSFMILSFVLGLIGAFKSIKKMKAAGSVNFVLLLTIPFASYGMDFEDAHDEDYLDSARSPVRKLKRKIAKSDKIPKIQTIPEVTSKNNDHSNLANNKGNSAESTMIENSSSAKTLSSNNFSQVMFLSNRRDSSYLLDRMRSRSSTKIHSLFKTNDSPLHSQNGTPKNNMNNGEITPALDTTRCLFTPKGDQGFSTPQGSDTPNSSQLWRRGSETLKLEEGQRMIFLKSNFSKSSFSQSNT